MSYQIGDATRVRVAFTDEAGAAIDPSTVALKVRAPNGTITTRFYGPLPDGDPDVLRESLGVYTYVLSLPAAGIWTYRWEGTGTIEAAAERRIRVEQSAFD